MVTVIREEKNNPLASLFSGLGEGIGGAAPDAIDQIRIARAGGDTSRLSPRLQEMVTSQQRREGQLETDALNRQAKKQEIEENARRIELSKEDRRLTQQARFQTLATDRMPGATDEERRIFNTKSDQFSNVKDPVKRFDLTRKAFEGDLKKIEAFSDLAQKASNRLFGASRSKLSNLSAQAQKMIEQGVDSELIEQSLVKSGLSETEIERVLSPNFARYDKLKQSLPQTFLGPAGQQLETYLPVIKEMVKSGASISLIQQDLRSKGLPEKMVMNILRQVSTEVDLTKRQQRQMINPDSLQEKRLTRIFGNV